MQPSATRYAFDREHIAAVVADGERQARIDAPSVDNDGAGAALAAVTALLGSRQVEAFAKKVQEGDARVIELDRSLHTIQSETR
jgi:hypothetical protein